MKKLRSCSFIIVMFAMFIFSPYSAHAELSNRGTDSLGNRLIYDSDLNITWYDYTKSYVPLGGATWGEQMLWASYLTVNFGGTIYDDWRLPTALNQDGTGPCLGYNCTGSEMGHLFYTELGNKGFLATNGNPQSGWGLTNTGNFQNLQPVPYWSGTEWAAIPSHAWYFYFYSGGQDEPATIRPSTTTRLPCVPEMSQSYLNQ
jgi:hypothetical protein